MSPHWVVSLQYSEEKTPSGCGEFEKFRFIWSTTQLNNDKIREIFISIMVAPPWRWYFCVLALNIFIFSALFYSEVHPMLSIELFHRDGRLSCERNVAVGDESEC